MRGIWKTCGGHQYRRKCLELTVTWCTASWLKALVLTYFGGHAIADDGNVVSLGSHCSNTILEPNSEV